MSAIASLNNAAPGQPGPSTKNVVPEETPQPRPVLRGEQRVEPKLGATGQPKLDGVIRAHLHPSPRIEARPVFHYDADVKPADAPGAGASTPKAAKIALTDGDLPASTAQVYDGRARRRKPQPPSSIDLFI